MTNTQLSLFQEQIERLSTRGNEILEVITNDFGLHVGPDSFVSCTPDYLGRITIIDDVGYEIEIQVQPPDPRILHLVTI